jgi:glycosyltransferase involved in cell wall biosynthesis
MRIAVMMRAMDKDAGFLALIQGLVAAMLENGKNDSFVLIHKTPKWISRFSGYPNVRPVLAPNPSNFLWDQLTVPYVAWREQADVIFNAKFFIPFLSPCPVTMGLQEPSWFTRPSEYGALDRWYQQLMIPLSIRRSAHVFPNSKFILEENRGVLNMPIAHATLQYSAADPRFQPASNPAEIAAFRTKYELPPRSILVVTRVIHPGMKTRQFFPGKSPEVAFRAFAKIRDRVPHQLVFAGNRIREYLLQTEGPQANFERVKFIKFVPFEAMHLLYQSAEIFVNPCMYEGCPNTVLQAMACGNPMVVAAAGGSADVAESAALMARPMDADDFAEKILSLCRDDELRRQTREKSLARSAFFSWDKTAKATLEALRTVVANASGSRSLIAPA